VPADVITSQVLSRLLQGILKALSTTRQTVLLLEMGICKHLILTWMKSSLDTLCPAVLDLLIVAGA
jgi:hypothetical protein